MNSTQLALKLLNGRQSAWLSVKQAAWLRDLIVRETKNPRPGKVLFLPGNVNDAPAGYQLAIAPNGAGLLKPVPTLRNS